MAACYQYSCEAGGGADMAMARAVRFFGRSFLGRSIAKRLRPEWTARLKQWAGVPVQTETAHPALAASAPKSMNVSDVWDKQVSEEFARHMNRCTWSGIPQVHANHNYLITGRRDYYWIRYVRDHYFPDGKNIDALSLGCGEGHVDRLFKAEGLNFRSFTGIDISAASVQKAQQLAEEMRLAPEISYFVADLNRYQLPPRSYDFIYFFQSLHHIEALESILASCAAALRPRGLLMVNEFVGPTRFQWTRQQVEMANHLLNLLPAELRSDLFQGGNVLKSQTGTPTIERMIAEDPSEAVRSGDIESVLREHFDIIEEKNWGGTLNYRVFEDIAGNFNLQNPLHECIIELLIYLENTLIAHKVIPSDFKFYMARPKTRGKDTCTSNCA